jgi:hypothetical protein
MNMCDFCGELVECPNGTRCTDCVNWCIEWDAINESVAALWVKALAEDDSPDDDDSIM